MMFEGYTDDDSVCCVGLSCWGVPLKEAVVEHVLPEVPNLKYGTLLINDNKPNEVAVAASKIRDLCNKIEKDIEYFNKYKGQAMAMNKLGVIKFDLLEIVKQLEK